MYKALTLPLIGTLFLHGLILAVLLIDLPDSEPMVKKAATQYIKAELITLDKPKAKKKPAAKPEPKPVVKKTDEAKQKAEQQAKQNQLEKDRAEQQRLQQQKKAQAQQQENERQQTLERQKELKRQSEQEFADAIAAENAEAQAMNDIEMANSYVALITQVIQNNWSRPASARNDMVAELVLQLVPTGEVVSVKVTRSSGNGAFDRSAESAVLKAERFPELKQLPPRIFEQYFRRLTLKFSPEDLRL